MRSFKRKAPSMQGIGRQRSAVRNSKFEIAAIRAEFELVCTRMELLSRAKRAEREKTEARKMAKLLGLALLIVIASFSAIFMSEQIPAPADPPRLRLPLHISPDLFEYLSTPSVAVQVTSRDLMRLPWAEDLRKIAEANEFSDAENQKRADFIVKTLRLQLAAPGTDLCPQTVSRWSYYFN